MAMVCHFIGEGDMKLETTRACRIQLNQPIHGTLETIVECKSADGRRRMGTVEVVVGWSLGRK